MTPTDLLTAFVVDTDADAIPADAIAHAHEALVDTVGVMLPGARSVIGETIRHYVVGRGGTPEAIVFGERSRYPAEWAALANGTAAHALDYDDSSHPLHGHPSAVVLPALIASASPGTASATGFMAAYLIGFEVEAALARALNLAHYRAGWHATATLGTLGAAAAAARLKGCSHEETRNAIGIAASSAAGLRANFGGYTKPLHAGQASMNGVRAVGLARIGWTASPSSLEDRAGFGAAFGGGSDPDWAAMEKGLGSEWTISQPLGLQLKPYPACGASHPAIDAALALRDRLDVDRIRAVHVGTSALLTQLLVHHDPVTPEQARFSLEYTLASAFLRGRVALADFEPSAISDPALRDFMARLSQAVDPRVAESTEFAAIVRVELDDGSVHEVHAELAHGKNANPLTEAERRRKFVECVGAGDAADAVWDAGHRLGSDGGDLDGFIDALRVLDLSLERATAVVS